MTDPMKDMKLQDMKLAQKRQTFEAAEYIDLILAFVSWFVVRTTFPILMNSI